MSDNNPITKTADGRGVEVDLTSGRVQEAGVLELLQEILQRQKGGTQI